MSFRNIRRKTAGVERRWEQLSEWRAGRSRTNSGAVSPAARRPSPAVVVAGIVSRRVTGRRPGGY